jgi:GntR family transcriptional repressor for pyruvate dehydrogenase complex
MVIMSDNDIFKTIPQREKLSDLVVDQLIKLIQEGKLKLGDRLPPERELAENFGVSRTVIRESIRSLVAKGLLEVRPGSGAVVSIPDPSLVAESMSMIMRLRAEGDLFSQIFEVRSLLEVEIAGLAAQRATAEDIRVLEDNYQRMAKDCGLHETAECDVEFHPAIAKATHNGLFPIILDSVIDVLLEVRHMALSVPGAKEEALNFHREIIDYIKDKDIEGARKVMSAHIRSGQKVMTTFIDQQKQN